MTRPEAGGAIASTAFFVSRRRCGVVVVVGIERVPPVLGSKWGAARKERRGYTGTPGASQQQANTLEYLNSHPKGLMSLGAGDRFLNCGSEVRVLSGTPFLDAEYEQTKEFSGGALGGVRPVLGVRGRG